MIWCEHCRDHYPTSHYSEGEDDWGNHMAGDEYGPTGRRIAAEESLPVSDDDPYRFRCAHSAYVCEAVAARVVELETALRDLANAVQEWDDRGNEVGSAVVRSVAAARRVLGDRPTEETTP